MKDFSKKQDEQNKQNIETTKIEGENKMTDDRNKLKGIVDTGRVELEGFIAAARERVATVRDKYKGHMDETYVLKQQKKINEGVESAEQLHNLVTEVSTKVEECKGALSGVSALAKREQGRDVDEESKQSLAILKAKYYAQGGLIRRAYKKVRGKDISIRDALTVVYDTVSELPRFVTHLDDSLRTNESGMTDLKIDIMKAIEDTVTDTPQIRRDISVLEKGSGDTPSIEQMETEYSKLEKIWEQEATEGKESVVETRATMERLDLTLKEQRAMYDELMVREERYEQNIALLKSQLKKIKQYDELLRGVRRVVMDTRNYVEIQVPYVMKEIESQKTQVQALTGADSILTFLETQEAASKHLNDRIRLACDFVGERIGTIRQQTIESPTIYKQLTNGQPTEK